MNKDAVQHERGPRNSTLRRQMAMFIGGKDMISSDDVKKIQQDLVFRAHPIQPPIAPYILDLSPRNRGLLDPTAYRTPMMPAFHPFPLPPPDFCTPDFHEKQAAKIILNNNTWIKERCTRDQLSMNDQLILLEHSWTDLFILGAAQCLSPFTFNLSLIAYRYSGNSALVQNEANQFHSILIKLNDMNIDDHEYNYIRAIALYGAAARIELTNNDDDRSSSSKDDLTKARLDDKSKILSYHDEALADLAAYINSARPFQPSRLKDLMLMLEQLKHVSSYTMEELFFRKSIGNELTIVKLTSDLYKQPTPVGI